MRPSVAFLLFSFVLSVVLSIGCRSSDASLAESARSWNNAINAKNVELITSFFADDSVGFYPRSQPSMSKSVIHDNWTDFFQLKNASHPITADKIITSSSGDLGYVLGSWQYSYDDQRGHQQGGGKYVAVWRRNGGGPWRIVAISANEYEEPKK